MNGLETSEVIMGKINLYSVSGTNSTTISNIFIDSYMPTANGSYVKVYLYLLRCLTGETEDFSIPFLADRLENTEADIIRALKYWEKVQLLEIAENEAGAIISIALKEPKPLERLSQEHLGKTSFDKSTEIFDVSKENSHVYEPPKHPTYTDEQITKLSEDEQVKWIMNIIEHYLERTLKPKDIQLILYLYDSVGFSTELIMYLYEYCISKDKKNPSYIETVALAWAEQGICTVEQAEESNALYNSNYSAVSKAFGLNRSPGAIEKQYIDKWLTKYKFSIDIIIEACNRTILNTQKADFKYTDKILENWHNKGVKLKKDISQLDVQFNISKSSKNNSNYHNPAPTIRPNGFNAFPQRNYSKEDYADIEQRLLHKS